MARPPQITKDVLRPLLMLRGPVSATELAAILRVNRTTIGRALPDFGEELVTLGATRSSRYLLRRSVRNAGHRWPIYRIDETGQAHEWAELEALHERHWRIQWAAAPPAWADHFLRPDGLWDGFPFFLNELRPQGFLGRVMARQMASLLVLPDDLNRWSDEDTLVFLQAASEDLPGNLVIGDGNLRRALARSLAETTIGSTAHYPLLAREAANNQPGSSAGGEHPKFLTTLRSETRDFQAVLVKFSPPMDQPVGQRWADLLLGESHALTLLAEVNLAEPGARIVDLEDRRFLEVPRFDRCGRGGRRGVVSLASLQASLLDSYPRTWPEAALGLLRAGVIQPDALETIQRLHAFGELIGNNDMHLGNLAFWLEDSLPFRVAPIYDMLPMLWAPGSQGEMTERPFAPLPPLPVAVEAWREAAGWAELFWERVTGDARISDGFARRAQECLTTVKNLRHHVGG